MKKLLIVGFAALSLAACDSKKKNKESETPVKHEAAPVKGGVKIAYYVLDSLTTTFEVYKSENDAFEKEGMQLQNQMQSMQKEYERLYSEYEKGMRQQVLTPNQIANYEQRIGGVQQRVAEFQNTKMVDFQNRQMKANEAIQNKIKQYSEEFAIKKGIDLFLVSGMGSNVAYANASMDVTKDFVKYMNEQESSKK